MAIHRRLCVRQSRDGPDGDSGSHRIRQEAWHEGCAHLFGCVRGGRVRRSIPRGLETIGSALCECRGSMCLGQGEFGRGRIQKAQGGRSVAGGDERSRRRLCPPRRSRGACGRLPVRAKGSDRRRRYVRGRLPLWHHAWRGAGQGGPLGVFSGEQADHAGRGPVASRNEEILGRVPGDVTIGESRAEDCEMPSPFPGMDPYLEAPYIWPDLHHKLVDVLQGWLNRHLPRPYYARLEMRPEVGVAIEAEGEARRIIPDVAVVKRSSDESAVAVASLPRKTLSRNLEISVSSELYEHAFVEVRDSARGHELVTLVEIVSPPNKYAGPDREAYLQIQAEV